MAEPSLATTSQSLPYGATEIHLGTPEYSDELAARLAESGASDAAIDAAGGPGTAERLLAEVRPNGDALATTG
jgi:hypothetical protein